MFAFRQLHQKERVPGGTSAATACQLRCRYSSRTLEADIGPPFFRSAPAQRPQQAVRRPALPATLSYAGCNGGSANTAARCRQNDGLSSAPGLNVRGTAGDRSGCGSHPPPLFFEEVAGKVAREMRYAEPGCSVTLSMPAIPFRLACSDPDT